jgi:hypothetical protein
MPAKAGIQAFLLDSRQSLSPQALGGEHAGMTSWGHGHFILWSCTEVLDMNETGDALPGSLCLTVSPGQLGRFHSLLREGFLVEAEPGCTIKVLLCGQFGVSPEYLEARVQTVFLDGKPVDDMDRTTIPAGATLALSAAMPGLVGATLRRGGYYAPLRSEITCREQPTLAATEASMVRVKLFNLLAQELAPTFLAQGIWLSGLKLREFLSRQPEAFWAGCQTIHLDGAPATAAALRGMTWSDRDEPVRLRVVVADRVQPPSQDHCPSPHAK